MLLVPGAVSWVLLFRKQVCTVKNKKTGVEKRLLDSCYDLDRR